MSYCYCSPSRSLRRDVAPGTTPREAGITYLSGDMVMGTKGTWVFASQRANALKGWETRRRLQAEAHARLMASAEGWALAHPEVVPPPSEHCDHAEEETEAKETVTVIVIEEPTKATEKVLAPVDLVLV